MDTLLPPGLAEWKREHPGADIGRVEGTWHAWVPEEPGSCSGAAAHADDADGLLAKLRG